MSMDFLRIDVFIFVIFLSASSLCEGLKQAVSRRRRWSSCSMYFIVANLTRPNKLMMRPHAIKEICQLSFILICHKRRPGRYCDFFWCCSVPYITFYLYSIFIYRISSSALSFFINFIILKKNREKNSLQTDEPIDRSTAGHALI